MNFEVIPHPKCLRGLHFLYKTDRDFDPNKLAAALEQRCGPCVRGDEQWGQRTVPRIIVMFQVEYRIGERDREVSLIHRMMASEAKRALSEQWLREALAELGA